MTNKKDMRFSKADQAIQDSFLELLKKNEFSKISVKKIIDEAGINRSTFYAHYLDKYDLMDKIQDSLLDSLISDLPDVDWTTQGPLVEQFQQRSIHIVQNINQHRELVALMLSDNAGHTFESHLQERGMETFSSAIDDEHLAIPRDYAMVLLTSIVSTMLTTWVKKDFAESTEEFTNIIKEIMPKVVVQLIK
ncbi:TetR/AcrR family transcriptional regulator [Fructobacillus sp. CRL 2054]|uniref:TetR/AcrR family transcriptional regulator n=1 Tax=Fructobacillus sp. CRL 2054 TaxID=2763007 RepID=UPI002379B2E3|nr:TetR/AcrR family transcriptional regulator [Fructobacillus sp. CRL 2054]MDD9138934.1 TetR/AcrR family transcriptional regulator [Fructobacillus sp. CRL 2054]